MRVFGVDFTSVPSARKPIVCASATFRGGVLHLDGVENLTGFAEFEGFLARPGPWIAGFDFPFQQSRRFLDNMGWPLDWAGVMEHMSGLTRADWRELLEKYKAGRQMGDREHPRMFEKATGAASPQKLYGVPVALMFHAGPPRLWAAGLDVPGLHAGNSGRIAVEAYPGMAARALIGRRPYKAEGRDAGHRQEARRDLLAALTGPSGQRRFGFEVVVPAPLAQRMVTDPKADALDAALAAAQAGWALQSGFHLSPPPYADPVEGWMADPGLLLRASL